MGGEGVILTANYRSGQDRRLAPGQHDVIEVHAGRAGDVQTVDQLEAGDAEGHPRKIRLVAQGKSDGEGAKLRADPVTRIERSRDEHLHVEGAEAIDAQGLARNLTIASDPIAQALQAEELAVERPDEDPVQIVDPGEVLRLETRREIGWVEVRRLERALSRCRLLGPKGLHEESFLTEARVLRTEPWLEGEERARSPHGELGWPTPRPRRMTLGDDRIEPDHLAMGELRGVGRRAHSFHDDVVEADDVLEALRHAGDNQTKDTEPGEHGQGRAEPS